MDNIELKALMEKKGSKQRWLADKLEITESLVSQWINGTKPITKRHIPFIKKLLEV